MIGVDTNVIIRLITGDDPAQLEKVKDLFRRHDEIFIPDTVILETEWVLRHAYRFRPRDIHRAISELCGLPNVVLADPERLFMALSRYIGGMDFADAFHSSWCADCESLYTFDIRFAREGEDYGVRLLSES